MPTYLEIAVNIPQVAGVFHYHLPPELEGRVGPGHLVVVPFGQQAAQGVVLREVPFPSVPETRPVSELVDPAAVLTPQQIALAEWLASATLAPLASCVALMLPPGLAQRVETRYTLAGDPAPRPEEPPFTPLQKRLLDLLEQRGALRGGQIDQALPRLEWRGAARQLVRRGAISAQSFLPPPHVQPKFVRTAQLAAPPEVAAAALPTLGRAGTPALERRQAVLRFLLREPGPVDVAWVYAESGGSLADLYALEERGLVALGESEVWRDPLARLDFQPATAPQLTQDQAAVWAEVRSSLEAATAGQSVSPLLLHGVTGSGKTEIYLRAVEHVLAQGRQAIILVPEIALTPQTVRRFVSRFPGRVGLVHSDLSTGERYDTWRRARAGALSLVVGPRSALFTPFPNLGLVVVDEFHDDSYFQSDPLPYYHAREAAIATARLAGGVCILGSATPDVASAYQAEQGRWRLLRLPVRILAHQEAVRQQLERLESAGKAAAPGGRRFHPYGSEAAAAELPPVQVVDMRQELRQGNRSIFSRDLQAALRRVLAAGEQAILFLNRRGAATFVFCRECGHTLKCPRCDLPLTSHTARPEEGALTGPQLEAFSGEAQSPRLFCHSCGYTRSTPAKCPQCGSRHIRQYGTGTQKLEAEVQALFPEARTLRWDYDTTRQKGAHEIILSHFAAHRADVLVGTQMLAKGLDLPLVTLVGVVLADVGLSLPDYRAGERTFQVLTQVAGRAGRSPLGGEVILQTFQPEHYALQAAAGHDYAAFYTKELEYRRQLGYPPFTALVRLEYRHADPAQAEAAARRLAEQVRQWLEADERRATRMTGPAPCFFARQNGLYRWQIVLRGPDPASLLKGRALADWRIEVNPPSLL